MTNESDKKLEAFLKENKPTVPGAPPGELDALRKTLKQKRPKPLSSSRGYLTPLAVLAASVAIVFGVLSSGVLDKEQKFSPSESAELAGFAYESIVEVTNAEEDSVLEENPLYVLLY